jgi:hypothetical protein
VLGLAAAALLPAGASAATSSYRVVKASGTMKITFTADPNTCTRNLTCGYSGTVTYKFGGTPHGKLKMKQGRNGHIHGAADFTSHGRTVSNVETGAACTDTIGHRREHFTLESHSRLGRLVFQLHGGKTDHLVTDCAGPTEDDLEHDHALPEGTFKRKDFEAQHTLFGLKGTSAFRERGYRGTSSWKLKYRLRRR